MNEQFVKKLWEEDDVLFYIYFKNGKAIRQIEISSQGKKFLSIKTPSIDGSTLCERALEELELEDKDFITKEEFEETWRDK